MYNTKLIYKINNLFKKLSKYFVGTSTHSGATANGTYKKRLKTSSVHCTVRPRVGWRAHIGLGLLNLSFVNCSPNSD